MTENTEGTDVLAKVQTRVLLTGATGFLGPHVSTELRALNCEVFPASTKVGFDLTRREDVLSAFVLARPNIVVHLADLYPDGRNPAQIFHKRTVMALNLFEAAAQSGAKVILVVRAKKPRWSEEYIESDAYIARALHFYREQYALQACAVGLPEVYGLTKSNPTLGPGYVNMMIAAIVHAKISEKGTLPPFQNHAADAQHYLHVSDAAAAIVKAAMGEADGQMLWAVGPVLSTLHDVAFNAINALQLGAEATFDPPPNTEPMKIELETDPALGWQPKVQPDVGVSRVARDYYNLEMLSIKDALASQR